MINSTNSQEDANLIGKTADAFIEYYNENIPDIFPHATRKSLNAFKAQYPSLFKEDDKWVVMQHRKKYMDWLASYTE